MREIGWQITLGLTKLISSDGECLPFDFCLVLALMFLMMFILVLLSNIILYIVQFLHKYFLVSDRLCIFMLETVVADIFVWFVSQCEQ